MTNPIIVRVLEEARPVSAMCALLREEFDMAPSRCHGEEMVLLNEPAYDNLVEVVGESTE